MHVLCLNFFKHTKVLRLEMTRGIYGEKFFSRWGMAARGKCASRPLHICTLGGGGGGSGNVYYIPLDITEACDSNYAFIKDFLLLGRNSSFSSDHCI